MPRPETVDGARAPRISRRTLVLTPLSLLLAAALLAWLMPRATGVPWSRVARTLGEAPPLALAALPLLALVALGASAVGLRTAIPHLALSRAVPASAATTALSVAVPGGSTLAVGVLYALARREGARRTEVLAGIAAVTAAETAVGLLLVPLGVGALLLGGPTSLRGAPLAALAALSVGCLLVLAAGALALRRPVLAGILARLERGLDEMGLAHLAEGRVRAGAVLEIRDAAVARLRAHGAAILGAPLAVRAAQAAALLVALRAVGLEVPVPQAIAVFVLGRLLALVPLTPGGAGLAETGSAAALIALGHDPAASGAAAVLMTVTTLLIPVALGLLAVPALRRARLAPAGDEQV